MRDVTIVGAGPVGLLLGILLADRGVDVAIVDERPTDSPRSRAVGIHPPSLRVLAGAGIAGEALARGVRIAGGEVWSDGRVLGRMRLAEAGAGYPFVLTLPQAETEGLLRARLEQVHPGAVRRGTRAVGIRQQADRVELALARADGSETLESARYVVGADGARSVVRVAGGIGWRAVGRVRSYVMADVEDDSGLGPDALLYFERGGVVESFPLPQGRRRWVALTDRVWEGATVQDLAELIAERTGIRPPRGAGVVSAFSARQHLAARLVAGRLVLAGDAAHEVSPIGGQGMNLGWLDAAALAPALAAALQGDADALGRYDAARRRSARVAVRQAGFNMLMGLPATGARLAARNAIVRTLAVPPLRGMAASAFTMRRL